MVIIGDSPYADDVHLIGGIVESAVKRAVVADGRDHDDSVSGQFPHFIHERVIHEVRPADGQVQHVDFLQDGVVEGVEEPRGVGDLVVGEDAEDVKISVGSEAETIHRTRNYAGDEGTVT